MDKQYKQFTFQTKVLDEKNRIIEMVGSTESFDRVSDRMKMAGVQLANYQKNPVILANHSYGYEEKPTVIGKALSVRIEGEQLIFKIQFAETDNGKEWFYLYANGYMNASSIGFTPLEHEPNDEGGYDFTKWELLELSLVAVPCNPEAVQRAYSEGHISKALFDEIQKGEKEPPKTKKEDKDMTPEEIQALIDKAIAGIKLVDNTEIIKALETQIKELTEKLKAQPEKGTGPNCADCAGGQCEGCCCCECAKSSCKGCTETPNPEKSAAAAKNKSGASISRSNKETIQTVVDGIMGHCKSLADIIKNDGDGDEGKDYDEAQIQKDVQEKLEKLLSK